MGDTRLLEPNEWDELRGQQVTFLGFGLDAAALKTDDGRVILIAPCFAHCGPEGHLNIFETDESVIEAGEDYEST